MFKSVILAFSLVILICGQVFAGGLESFMSSLNVQARADLPGFSARVGAQFGVPAAQVQAVIQTVRQPADAFMVFQLGQMSRQPTDVVVQKYRVHKGGWGKMAKSLGIKPGSKEFHALKRGDFALTGTPDYYDHDSNGKGKGKGKGHNK